MSHEILRVSIKGTMPGGEAWSINPTYATGVSEFVPFEIMNELATDIAGLALGAGLQSVMSPTCAMIGARVELRDLDGTLQAVSEANRGSATIGTGTAPHPYQTSAVVSLRSEIAGGSGRGRVYWPATGCAMDANTLRMSAAVQTSFLNAMNAYLASIETVIDEDIPGSYLCVWSRTKGARYRVTRLTVGDVLDTQRRRRDALRETLAIAAYAGV